MKTKIKHRKIPTNGIQMHLAEAGEGPLVILVHGFPEFWYSWRNQLPALAKAGYHAVAPDLRGLGQTDITTDLSGYSLINRARDVKGILDYFDERDTVFIGHDWGANLVWIMPMLYPDKVKAVACLSIPFDPEPRDPAVIREKWPSVFTNFTKKGITEAEFDKDPDRFFRKFFYALSGDAPDGTVEKLYVDSTPDDRLMDIMPEPEKLPGWLTEKDLDQYVDTYRKTGITGALSLYRVMDEDYPKLKELYKTSIDRPVLFIGGAKEAAVKYIGLETMENALPKLKKTLILENCGHWVQQERPEEVNKALIEFLDREIKNK